MLPSVIQLCHVDSQNYVSWCIVAFSALTHWGRVTHICFGKLTIFGSDNGLSPGRRPAIIWTNAGILIIGPLGTNFSEILIAIEAFSFRKMHLKISSAKWRPFCLGLNVLTCLTTYKPQGWVFTDWLLGPLLLTWLNFNPSMDIWLHPL